MPLFRNKSPRRIFGRSHAEFLQGPPRPVAWRLEVREDAQARGMFMTTDLASQAGYGSANHLASYISAGGMRDLRPGRHSDANASRRRFVIQLALFLLAFWLTFLLVPCG